MSYSHDPSSAAAAPGAADAAAAGSYRVCDAVVLLCLAFACGLIVFTVAVCFRRAFAQGYAAAGGGGGAAAAASRRRGLAPSQLSAIPRFVYRRGGPGAGAGAAGGGWAQCAICLGVVRDGEVVRRLPACRHLFHVECIDMWLYSHATCPLCRCDVAEAAAVAGEKV